MKFAALAALAAVVVLSILTALKRRKKIDPKKTAFSSATSSSGVSASQAENAWSGLRNMVLTLKPEEMGVQSGSDDTYGFIMETGYANQNAKVTVVALRGGTMSLYLSTGGGTIGTGQRSSQAGQLAKDVVAAVKNFVSMMERTTAFPVPATGRVRFFVLTGQGVFTAESNDADLRQRRDPFVPLFAGGENIITQIRLASEGAVYKSQ